MSYTTIQIDVNTRKKLNKLKNGLRLTYDELLNILMELIPNGDEEGEYSDEFKLSLLRGLLDIKQGRTSTVSEVKKKLGIE